MKVSDVIAYIMKIMGFDFKKIRSSSFRDKQKGAESQDLGYTRGVLRPEYAPGARSGSKAPPCVPTNSWVYFILGSRISTPQNAPRYLTG